MLFTKTDLKKNKTLPLLRSLPWLKLISKILEFSKNKNDLEFFRQEFSPGYFAWFSDTNILNCYHHKVTNITLSPRNGSVLIILDYFFIVPKLHSSNQFKFNTAKSEVKLDNINYYPWLLAWVWEISPGNSA